MSKRVNDVLLERHRITPAEAHELYGRISEMTPYAEDYLGKAGDFSEDGGHWRLISWVKEELYVSTEDQEMLTCLLRGEIQAEVEPETWTNGH